jgi:hypothetical protein
MQPCRHGKLSKPPPNGPPVPNRGSEAQKASSSGVNGARQRWAGSEPGPGIGVGQSISVVAASFSVAQWSQRAPGAAGADDGETVWS